MKLAVVVPCLNHLYFTMKTVESLFSATETQDSALILVDDGSTDETCEYAGDLFKKYGNSRVHYVRHAENRGVSAAWNSGIRCARAIEAEYIAIVNNDLLFAPGWDIPLIRALEADHKLAVVSPMSTEQRLPDDWPEGKDRHENPAGYVGYMPILGAAFCCKLSLFNETGYFPESMRVFWSDNWFVMAAQRLGYECGYARESYLHHAFCMTTTGIKDPSIWRNDKAAFDELVKDWEPLKPYQPNPRTR